MSPLPHRNLRKLILNKVCGSVTTTKNTFGATIENITDYFHAEQTTLPNLLFIIMAV